MTPDQKGVTRSVVWIKQIDPQYTGALGHRGDSPIQDLQFKRGAFSVEGNY